MTAALTAVAPWLLVAATTTKKSSGGSPILLILVVVGAAFYFLIYRPQQKKARAVREQGAAFDVGDEVLTAGGIVGYIIEIDGDRVTLETSVGASFVVLRQYVLRKIEPPVDTDDDGSYDEGDYDDAEHDEHDGADADHEDGEDADHEEHDTDADVDAEADPTGDKGSTNGSGGKPGTTRAADGDDSGDHDAPPII